MTLQKMGITIGTQHSYNDFDLLLSDRDISLPERTRVAVTVPHMSGYYDFSTISGAPCYGSRTLEYTFDVLEDSAEAVEAAVNAAVSWAMTAQESAIYDDYDPDYYFIGSYSSAKFRPDDELPELGGELELTFVAQPYRYSRTTDEAVI